MDTTFAGAQPADRRLTSGPQRPLVVMHVLEAIAGGTSRHLIDLVSHTGPIRHVVVVPRSRVGAVPDESALPRLKAAGAQIHLVEMRRNPVHPLNLVAMIRLTALARRLHPDVIHGHSAVGGALARIVPAPRHVTRAYTPNGLNQSRMAMTIERMLVRRTDRFVAVSPSEGELLTHRRLAESDCLSTIPNAIEPRVPDTTLDLRELAGFPAEAPLVGTVSRLVPQKAPERFVECCRLIALEHPHVRFLLIGDGPLADTVDAAADCDELRDRFVRIPSIQDVAETLGQLDVFVLLSRFEGGPYTPLEAMRGGTPAVLSDCVGNIDVPSGRLRDLIAADGDPRAAANHVLRLLADPTLREVMGADARRQVSQHFNVATMGLHHTLMYRQLAALRHRGLEDDLIDLTAEADDVVYPTKRSEPLPIR